MSFRVKMHFVSRVNDEREKICWIQLISNSDCTNSISGHLASIHENAIRCRKTEQKRISIQKE